MASRQSLTYRVGFAVPGDMRVQEQGYARDRVSFMGAGHPRAAAERSGAFGRIRRASGFTQAQHGGR
jgi:hypothetical protein